MHFRRALLFTVGIGVFSATALLAQRGGGHGAHGALGTPGPLPSSTALGAGALTVHPSSTARSTAPAIGGYGYLGSRTYSRSNGYGNRNFGYSDRGYHRLPRSYFIAPYYYPFYDWGAGTDYSASAAPYDNSDYGPGPGYGPDPSMDPTMANQAALGDQVQRLTAQMNDLMSAQQQAYQPQSAAPPQPPPVPLTLVLRNGEKLQVQNYAVTNSTLWDFTQRGTRKIPLSNIDLQASAKATEANGGEFPQIDGKQ
jgi:hypothetical protein